MKYIPSCLHLNENKVDRIYSMGEPRLSNTLNCAF